MKTLRIIIVALTVSVVLSVSGPWVQEAESTEETLKLMPIPSPEITGLHDNLVTAISNEAESLPVDRLNVSRRFRIIAQGSADFLNSFRQSSFRHHRLRPYHRQELIFGHQLSWSAC